MADLQDNGLNRRIKESEAIVKECEDLDAEIAALRAAYEQYFMGIERMPPVEMHKAVTKRLAKLKGQFVRQTAQKFRINNLQTKLSSYERLWSRTLKEIEDGTYKRDVYKVKRKAQTQQKKPSRSDEPEQIDEVEEVQELPPPVEAAPKAPEPGKSPSLPDLAAMQPLGGRTPSLSGVPAIQPLVKTPSLTGVPAIQPLTKTPSLPGVPSVQPLGGGRTPSLPGVPAVQPQALGASALPKTSTGLPSVAPVAKPGSGSHPVVPRPGAPAVGASRPQPSSPNAPRPVSATSPDSVSDSKLRAVYDAYVTAKKRNQEDTSKLSFESVAANLRKQVPELMKKHNAQGVDFKVVIKDGKAVLKAVPK